MFIGLFYVNIRFIEKPFCVSFTTRKKLKISKFLPDLISAQVELLHFAFSRMVGYETKAIAFLFPKVLAGEEWYLVMNTAFWMLVIPCQFCLLA